MRIAITGTPGTGKTTVAKALARRLKARCINELAFAKSHGIGRMDKAGSEWIVPAKRLERELNKELEKAHKGHFDIIVEGHVLCELCLEIDLAVVLKANARVLEKRLLKKKYSLLKALDNLYCEENDYCLKNALHNFGRKKLFVVRNEKGIKAILNRIVSELKKRKFA